MTSDTDFPRSFYTKQNGQIPRTKVNSKDARRLLALSEEVNDGFAYFETWIARYWPVVIPQVAKSACNFIYDFRRLVLVQIRMCVPRYR